MDPSDPRFPLAVAVRRVELREAERSALVERLLAAAEGVLTEGGDRTASLARAAALADTLALVDADLQAGRGAVDEARARARAAGVADEEVADLAAGADPLRHPHPIRGHEDALGALARAVEMEAVREAASRRRAGEMRLLLGSLRLFDETGMPPSGRTQSGSGGEPGCPTSSCPTDLAFLPADAPWEHAPAGGGEVGPPGSRPDEAALRRLGAWLADALGRERAEPSPPRGGGVEGGELSVGVGGTGFRSRGEGRAGPGFVASAAWMGERDLGGGRRLVLEPVVGIRSFRVSSGSAGEVAAEARETLAGAVGSGGARWQVAAWQKGRHLSRELPPPVYLEPCRVEGGVVARLSREIRSGVAVEVGGGGDAVRYFDEGWREVDRLGWSGSVALVGWRPWRTGRLSLSGARHVFPAATGVERTDTRVGVGADAKLEGRVVMNVSLSLVASTSTRPGYDHGAARGAWALAAPWGGGSVQAYLALAYLGYRGGGALGAPAPSDEDAGALVAVQLTRPAGPGRVMRARVQWARSRTGFGAETVERVGAWVQVALDGGKGR